MAALEGIFAAPEGGAGLVAPRRSLPALEAETDMKMLLALALLLQTAVPSAPPKPADYPQIRNLAPDVYAWSDVHPSGLYTTNDLIVITADGVLVADGQRDVETTRKMVERIATLTDQPIKVVVIGSEHGDIREATPRSPAGQPSSRVRLQTTTGRC
jgi:hypothetical protein